MDPKTHRKLPGTRSEIPLEKWERLLYEYHEQDRTARSIATELQRDHSSVVRKFAGMLRRAPGLLDELRQRFADPALTAHEQGG